MKEAEEKGRKLARDVEEKLNSTINDYESHINSLRGQLQQMENELQSHDRSMLSMFPFVWVYHNIFIILL